MTDRFNYLTVALDSDIRDEDAEELISAIRQFRGVQSVEGNVSDPTAWTAQERAKQEYRDKIAAVLWPDIFKDKSKSA